jgi:hypothetical protein
MAETHKRLRRGSSTTSRASASTIAKFFDVQLPALTEYLTPLASVALAATSKERLAALGQPPALKALGRALPMFLMPAVMMRIRRAPQQGLEVAKMLIVESRAEPQRRELQDCEFMVEVTLLDGTRINQTVDFHNVHVRREASEDTDKLFVDFSLEDWARPVLFADHDFDDEEGHFTRPQCDWFLSAIDHVADVKVTLVRSDGKFLPLFKGPVGMRPHRDNDVWDNSDYENEYPFDVPIKWYGANRLFLQFPHNRLTNYADDTMLDSHACIRTECVAAFPRGKYAYNAVGLEMKLRWLELGGGAMGDKELNVDRLMRVLQALGDWR